jgi:hypothetical protein
MVSIRLNGGMIVSNELATVWKRGCGLIWVTLLALSWKR